MGDQQIILHELRRALQSKQSECLVSNKVRSRPVDKHTKKLLFYLFAGTCGGITRLRIITCLLEQTRNSNQLAGDLELDYKAVTHHMKVLERNNMVSKIGDGRYGVHYRISDLLESNLDVLDIAIDKLLYNIARKSKKKVYY